MKAEDILTFALVVFLAIVFIGAISLSTNTLQATEVLDAEYAEPATDIPEVIELVPAPTSTEAVEEPDPESENEIMGEDDFEMGIEESVVVEEETIVEESIEEELIEEKTKEPLYRVEIIANIPIGSVVNEGDIITMTAVLYGFDNLTVTYQWYRLVGADWVSIENATAQSYSFAATEETVDCWYNVYVTIVE